VRRSYAPLADWLSVGPGAHAVQFYSSEGHLLDLLTRYVGTALISGDAAIVIATKAHRDGLIKRLRGRGFDVSVPRDDGRFIALDAAATLAKFTRDGRIDHELFHQAIGEAIGRMPAKLPARRIVAFGEIVALLWRDGRHESAIQLEQFWNELAREYSFSLCCAYPMHGFGNRHAAPFMQICAQHTHVFTAPADAARPTSTA
jgi:DcmR-like sensory protein